MNLVQLRAICEVVKQDMRVSAAAHALFKAQPGISRQIKEIESELGVQIFHRQKNRIAGLTPAGREVLEVARRMLLDAESLRAIGKEHSSQGVGELVISTTHTHARYSLPPVIEKFSERFPKVKLTLRQVSPVQAYELVASGEADIGICMESSRQFDDLVSLPIYSVAWDVIAATGHAIFRQRPITLESIARWPLITQTFSGQRVITEAIAKSGGSPHVLLTGADADVSKEYVARGLGLAILAKVAYEPGKDKGVRPLNVEHLFQRSVLDITIRRYHYLRSYAMSFISLYAPHLPLEIVRKVLAGDSVDLRPLKRRLPELLSAGSRTGR